MGDWVKICLEKRVHCANKFKKKSLLMTALFLEFDNGRERLKPLKSPVSLIEPYLFQCL